MASIFDHTTGFFKDRGDRYKNIEKPVHIALSGGRSSAAMLRLLLEIHGGELPSNYQCVFTNTGKEHEATLQFLKDIEQHWQVPIIWLELTEIINRRKVKYRQVDFATASRHGEPFKALLRDNEMVPRRALRTCTYYLKALVADAFLAEHGHTDYVKMIGFRADETHRLHRIQLRCATEQVLWRPACPLITSGVNKRGVLAFWQANEFDLLIDAKWGNCTFCFLKPYKQLLALARENPTELEWWVAADQGCVLPSGQKYHMLPNGGYAGLKKDALGIDPTTPEIDDDLTDLECNCTD
jgi:hypothetical protein